MVLVFTICSNNYLAQAITLGQSLLAFNKDYCFKIGLVDRKNKSIDYSSIPYEIIEVEDIGIDDWDDMILRYNIQELNTAVKPFFFKYFINVSKIYEKIIYLDPDILIYDSFSDLENLLDHHDIVILPHITVPIEDDKRPSENDFLNTGIYNLGFIAIRISQISSSMLAWWGRRLKTKGYNDVKSGMFTDQLWINFVPLFFEKVLILKKPGYNVAYWNLHERIISFLNNKYLVNGKHPLVFFHFSGFSPNKPDEISKYQNRFTKIERCDIIPLFQEYSWLLKNNNYDYFQTYKCHYNGIKEANDERIVLEKVKQIPILKRIVKKIINQISKKFNIILDYTIFYKAENLNQITKNEK